jgi:hypothetical protein
VCALLVARGRARAYMCVVFAKAYSQPAFYSRASGAERCTHLFLLRSLSLSVEFRSTHFVFFLPSVAAWLTNAAIMAPPQFFIRPAQRSGGPILWEFGGRRAPKGGVRRKRRRVVWVRLLYSSNSSQLTHTSSVSAC